MLARKNRAPRREGADPVLVVGLGRFGSAVCESLVARGHGALSSLARGLADDRPFVCGDAYTVADIALYAYVHCAHEAGADAREHGTIGAWLDRVEATPGFETTNWSAVSNAPIVSGTNFLVTNSLTASNRFYRLRRAN